MDAQPDAQRSRSTRVSDVVRDGDKFTAKAEGTLRVARQRGRARAAGQGTLDRDRVEAARDVRARHQEARPHGAEVLRVQDGGRGDRRGQRARRRAAMKRARSCARSRSPRASGKQAEASGVGPYHFGHTDARQRSTTASASRPSSPTAARRRGASRCRRSRSASASPRSTRTSSARADNDRAADRVPAQSPRLRRGRGRAVDARAVRSADREQATREYWKNSFLWVGAFLPSEPGRCIDSLAAAVARTPRSNGSSSRKG